jgi:hypothetical protein
LAAKPHAGAGRAARSRARRLRVGHVGRHHLGAHPLGLHGLARGLHHSKQDSSSARSFHGIAGRRLSPAKLLVGMDGVHHPLILLAKQRHAGLELQLRLGQFRPSRSMETLFPSGRAISPSTAARAPCAWRVPGRCLHRLPHLGLEVHAHGPVAGGIDIGHVGRGQLGLAGSQVQITGRSGRSAGSQPPYSISSLPEWADSSRSVHREPEVDLPRGNDSSSPARMAPRSSTCSSSRTLPGQFVRGEFGHCSRVHSLDRRLAAHPLHEMLDQQRGRSWRARPAPECG